MARVLDEVETGREATGSAEVWVATAAGRQLHLDVTVQLQAGARSPGLAVVLFRDASEKRRIREEIRRADQLALLGEMSARVAHEIRTPLATIRGLTELLQADLTGSQRGSAYPERILQAVERQERLVEDLLALNNPEPETKEAVSLPELLEEVVGTLSAGPRVRLTTETAVSLPPVWGDPGRLGEVFTNLIRNALEATPAGGAVDVRVSSGGERACVSVRNTGAGIPRELHERIFQPFFTTKARGTGLGLAIARQIVEAHEGSIRVESDGKSETAFIVELPMTAPVVART
jgi:signal transduction histidine kinase